MPDLLARPVGDGASVALLASLQDRPPDGLRFTVGRVPLCAPVEHRIAVDQTNTSIVVGDPEDVAVVVKWCEPPFVGPHPAGERLRRLAAAAFPHTPELVGLVEWRTPDGWWVPIVSASTYLAGTTDGWTWCVGEARAALGVAVEIPGAPVGATPAVAGWATDLGDLTGRMHRALADADGLVLGHGDYHVGQVLRDGAGAMFVVDFDGNPTLPPAARVAPRPASYDIAGMLLSLENVGHVVRHHAGQQGLSVDDQLVAAWSEREQTDFLAAYTEVAGDLLDTTRLESLVVEQIQRELDYADAFLPRWRYVPEAALARRSRR